ncbi:MAG: hypothetical protein J5693_05645 [Bacteroidales bacterium]|nr:hypothetical protein [Bacteroidales bacterium]
MKKILSAIAALTLTAMLTVSCGLLGGSSATTSTDSTTSGTTAGKVLTALLSQYLTDGKFDTSNLSNLINLATLATTLQTLKGNGNNQSILGNFAGGLVNGSNNQISTTNSSTITSILASLVNNTDLSSLASLLTRSGEVDQEAAKAVVETDAFGAATNALTNVFKLMSH